VEGEKTQMPGLTSGLGSSELEILGMIWRMGQATVRDVFEEVRKTRTVTLPAVMLSMNRLVKRGLLNKVSSPRGAVYQPMLSRDQMASSLLGDLVDKVLQGSLRPVLSNFVERLSDEEIRELLDMVKSRQGS
jgi:BlaI family penicillinase repressor